MRPTYRVVEQELLPKALLTVRVKVWLQGGAVRPAVVHDPPLEFEKLVQVPLCGENVPFAGPFVIDQLRFVVWL